MLAPPPPLSPLERTSTNGAAARAPTSPTAPPLRHPRCPALRNRREPLPWLVPTLDDPNGLASALVPPPLAPGQSFSSAYDVVLLVDQREQMMRNGMGRNGGLTNMIAITYAVKTSHRDRQRDALKCVILHCAVV
jgi:hypothetical protein